MAIEGYLVHVEADVGNGLPSMNMVGYLASEVREAQDRVRSALKNSGFYLPPKKITINLSPADIRKEGTAFDLPISIAVLTALGVIEPNLLKSSMIVGELGLDGTVKPIKGALSLAAAAKQEGMKRCFLPQDNVSEGCLIKEIDVIGIDSLGMLVDMLNHPNQIVSLPERRKKMDTVLSYDQGDFADINGQFVLKRATEIAVAGNHNLLMLGQAGVGKTMIASRIPTIMPSLSPEECLEILKIYSVYGVQPPGGYDNTSRPFRSPHHTISPQALAGGGRIPKPGELSLASGGVLFLDEFPEFQRHTIEILRQPLEEHRITISRLQGVYQFPAHILLVAAMNPCPCGYYPDRDRCKCSPSRMKHYLEKISKPLLDRIDLCAEALPISFDDLNRHQDNESSAKIRCRVEAARQIQRERFKEYHILTNSEMKISELKKFCVLHEKEDAFLKKVFSAMDFSPRAYHKVLKVARTIADLSASPFISHEHLCEAIGYRSLEQKYWNGGSID